MNLYFELLRVISCLWMDLCKSDMRHANVSADLDARCRGDIGIRSMGALAYDHTQFYAGLDRKTC